MKAILVTLSALVCAAIGVLCSLIFLYRFVGFSGEGELILAGIAALAAGLVGMVVGTRAANTYLDR